MSSKIAILYRKASLIGTTLMTAFSGRVVGRDETGNTYYEQRRPANGTRARRWVIYNGAVEASRVPPEWHGWLHYTFDAPLDAQSKFHQPWQKPHQPNLTATDQAYHPPGSQAAGGVRDRATGDYQAWKPN